MQMFLFAVYTELWKAICFSKCLFRKKKKKGIFCANERDGFVKDGNLIRMEEIHACGNNMERL